MKDPVLIDCQYVYPKFAASYLVAESDTALFVDNNTAHSVHILLKSLAEIGMDPKQVQYLIVTHIHLDHAGGTSKLLQMCPNAIVLAHPRAAPHLIDPTKLINSAISVYGESEFKKLYREIAAIDASKVRVIADEEVLHFGTRDLRFFYTRGHANHHFCIFDSVSNGVFTGDSFGLAYPDLQTNGLFIFPSTSPTDFDPAEARISIQKILNTGAEKAYLTHFGSVNQLVAASKQLLKHLDFSEQLLEDAVKSPESDANLKNFCADKLVNYYHDTLAARGLSSSPLTWDIMKMDVDLNAAGIAHVATKKRHKR